MDRRLLVLLTVFVLLASYAVPVHSWSNGGYSANPSNPDYGTHDWLAHHALDFVPDNLDFWIRDNLPTYLYGTELPDNRNAVLGDGIGDTSLHHVYYRSDRRLQDDASARRARESCDRAISYLAVRDYKNAAKWMGVASHYISDLAVFGHVMGSSTDWGSEKHHGDYEEWVNVRTNRYDSTFVTYLRFDGRLDAITAYDVALRLAMDTTFDSTGKERTAKWMDDNYAPANPSYQERIGESLSLAVNLLADVIYSVSQSSQVTTTTTTTMTTSSPTSTTTVIVTTSYTSTSSSISTTTPTTTTATSTTSSPVIMTTTMTSSTGVATVTTTTSYTSTSSTALTTSTIEMSTTLTTSYSTITTATTQSSVGTSGITSQTQSTASPSTTQNQQRRCIIATAAYGSDLAPDVQLLREFRDERLLSTFARFQFMNVFNAFYYSFSPQVAEIVASNSLIAQVTRVVIAPLIHILKILMLLPATEAGSILGGLVAAALAGVIYLTLPLLLVRAFDRRDGTARQKR